MEPVDDSTVNSETFWAFSNLYKCSNNLKESQEQRRIAFLERQKERRHQLTDKIRTQCEEFLKLIQTGHKDEEMEYETTTNPREKTWKFKLMLSEWMTEIPEDLNENWLVKFAPEGFRVLIVCQNHNTVCYNQRGRVVLKVKSNLPGGGNAEGNGVTVLDCIYNKKIKTVFVLDCLFWNSMSMLDSEASFRFFWLKSKFDEEPELSNSHTYTFMLLDSMPAQRPLIQDQMFSQFQAGNNFLDYDGIVFYHKISHYVFGSTPLVAWLASYMLPEVLQIDVPQNYMSKKPKGYVCQQSYIEQLNTKKRKNFKKKDCVEMEL